MIRGQVEPPHYLPHDSLVFVLPFFFVYTVAGEPCSKRTKRASSHCRVTFRTDQCATLPPTFHMPKVAISLHECDNGISEGRGLEGHQTYQPHATLSVILTSTILLVDSMHFVISLTQKHSYLYTPFKLLMQGTVSCDLFCSNRNPGKVRY